MDGIRIPIDSKSVRFVDQLRIYIRQSGLAYRAEQTCVHWIKQFIFFHDKRHLKDMGAAEVKAYLAPGEIRVGISGHDENEFGCAGNAVAMAGCANVIFQPCIGTVPKAFRGAGSSFVAGVLSAKIIAA